jgi:hypothetical protein
MTSVAPHRRSDGRAQRSVRHHARAVRREADAAQDGKGPKAGGSECGHWPSIEPGVEDEAHVTPPSAFANSSPETGITSCRATGREIVAGNASDAMIRSPIDEDVAGERFGVGTRANSRPESVRRRSVRVHQQAASGSALRT